MAFARHFHCQQLCRIIHLLKVFLPLQFGMQHHWWPDSKSSPSLASSNSTANRRHHSQLTAWCITCAEESQGNSQLSTCSRLLHHLSSIPLVSQQISMKRKRPRNEFARFRMAAWQ